MKLLRTGIISCALILQCIASWAVYGVRISDLDKLPSPKNPIRVWGKVTSVSPVKITDGRAEITVSGLTASVGDYVVLTGYWNGSVFAANGLYTGEMVWIPAGSFQMGNSGVGDDLVCDQQGWCEGEKPQHSVDLTGYCISKTKVTRAQYRQFMNAGGYTNSTYWSTDGWNWKVSNSRTQPYCWTITQDWHIGQSFTQTENHPVIGVSYYEAEAFCNWAGGHLPTEAQWERAARWTGTHANVYPWGDAWDAEKCNNFYDRNSAGGGYAHYQTAAVGSYPSGASPIGCQDMAGNGSEWCQDWYASYPGSNNPVDYTNVYRVLRGGNWGEPVITLRCAARDYGAPSDGTNYIGFRIAQ